jgi:hypothetical protein
LLLRVFRRQGFWKSAVANQAKYITDLAQNIITRNEPELQSVGRHLLELGMLLSKSQKMDDANFIESIRDQADRIQEIAGRIIRQSLKP